eukprot:scaffold11326_cov144-Skeletonema_menzelii.AAC.3
MNASNVIESSARGASKNVNTAINAAIVRHAMMMQQGQQDCGGCIKRIVPLLVGENLERKQLQEENEQLKVEMEALKREIRELKLENEELRSRSVE